MYCEENPLTNRYDHVLTITIGIFIPFLIIFVVSFYKRTLVEDEYRDRKLEKALINKTRQVITGRRYTRVMPFVSLGQADLDAALRLRKGESFDQDIVERMREASEKNEFNRQWYATSGDPSPSMGRSYCHKIRQIYDNLRSVT